MEAASVTDSSDWLSTALPGLAEVEAALRCQVCKDFFTTPMITTCSHTFCSTCIRRALSNDGKCPVCRAEEQEIKLRPNWSLEAAVESFVNVRAAVIEHATAASASSSRAASKRKLAASRTLAAETIGPSEPAPKRLRSSARLISLRGAGRVPQEEVGVYGEDIQNREPSADVEQITARLPGADQPQTTTSPDSLEELDLVPCPSCQTRMKQWQVFCHLDRCPGPIQRSTHDFDGRDGDFIPQSPPRRLKLGAKMARPVNGLQPERLAAVNYSLLKDQSLRKKLVDLGISSTGPRPLLEKRHREWLTIWNANCDAARPKAKIELLRDLDSWERAQGARGPAASRAAVELRSSQFDSTAWATRYQSSFRDLISRAKSNIQQHLSVDAQQVMDGQPVNELTAEASTALEAAYELSQESVDVIASGSIEEDKCSREMDIQAANSLQS